MTNLKILLSYTWVIALTSLPVSSNAASGAGAAVMLEYGVAAGAPRSQESPPASGYLAAWSNTPSCDLQSSGCCRLGKNPHFPEAVPWTEVMQAAANGDDENLRRLLAGGADPNARSGNSWTPLMWAADGGHDSTVEILIRAGAKVDLADNKGTTALMLAAIRGKAAVVDALLKRGASPNASDKEGLTPLMLAASEGATDIVEKLLASGAKVDAGNKSGRTALMLATTAPAARMLLKYSADVHAKDLKGMTPLMIAAERHCLPVILALLQGGANVEAKDNQGKTARDWGYINNCGGIEDHHVLLEILNHQPAKNTVCKSVIRGREDELIELLRQGVSRDDLEKCEVEDEFLGGSTPLTWAVQAGNAGMVKLLLENRASVSGDNYELIHSAASQGKVDILRLLVKHGVVPPPDREARYWSEICEQKNQEIIRVLREYDASVCTEPSEYAKSHSCVEIIKKYGDRIYGKRASGSKVMVAQIERASMNADATVLKCLLADARKHGMAAESLYGAVTRAARKNRPESIRLLHEYGVDVNRTEQRDRRDITPLMWACMDGNLEAVRALIECGADLGARSGAGQTAIMYAQDHGFQDIVKLLRAHGARNDATLGGAAASGDVEKAEKMLRDGANINSRDGIGWSPLLWACAAGRTNMVRFLLQRGATTRVCGEILYSYPFNGGGYAGCFGPLEVAAHNGRHEVVRVLMEYRKGKTAEQGRPGGQASSKDKEALHSLEIAAEKGYLAVVKVLLEYGVDVNQASSHQSVNGSAALVKAVSTGHRDIVELLLRRGANPDSYEEPQGDSYDEPSALEIATREGHERIRQLLLRFGADYSVSHNLPHT